MFEWIREHWLGIIVAGLVIFVIVVYSLMPVLNTLKDLT